MFGAGEARHFKFGAARIDRGVYYNVCMIDYYRIGGLLRVT